MALRQELSIAQNLDQQSEKELNHKNMELNQLENQYAAIQQAHEKLLEKFQEHARELIIYKERCEQQQKNLQSLEQSLAEKTNIISQLEKQAHIEELHRIKEST